MVLKQFKVPRTFISEFLWQKVKDVGTMYPKGPLPCLFHHAGCTTWHTVGDSQPATSITPLSVKMVPINKALTLFPEKADLVAFTPPLLRVNSQEGKLFPVVHPSQFISPDLGNELSLHCFYLIDRGLVPWGPELATVVQPGLDETP